jgi:hypothetical protein
MQERLGVSSPGFFFSSKMKSENSAISLLQIGRVVAGRSALFLFLPKHARACARVPIYSMYRLVNEIL